MSNLPPPLLRRRSLLPGESLPSLLIRLSNANYYDPPSIVIGLALTQKGGNKYYTSIFRDLSPTILEYLKALTKLSSLALYSSTYHRFTPIITSSEVNLKFLELDNASMPLFTGNITQLHMRSEFAVQFCPECMKNLAYHHLIWTPAVVAVCLQHKCLLINCCPHCGRSIEIEALLKMYCARCKGNLTDALPIQVQNDEFGLFSQYVLQSWLIGNEIICFDKYFLPKKPMKTLYHLIYGLSMVLMQAKSDLPYLHHLRIETHFTAITKEMILPALTPYQIYCLYATAFKAVVNWPQSFYDFLDAYLGGLTKDKPVTFLIKLDFDNLYTWLEGYWHDPAFTFVQEAFNYYFIEKYSLVKIDRLTGYESQDACKSLRLDRSEIVALLEGPCSSLGIVETTTLTGMSLKMVYGMVEVGLFSAELSPLEGYRYWRINQSSIMDIMNILASKCQVIDKKSPLLVNLTTASRLYVTKSGFDSSYLILEVINGLVHIYLEKGQPLKVHNFLFDRSDIDASLARLYAQNGWINKIEAIKLLRTSLHSLYRWVDSGLLKMTRKMCFVFDKKEIEEFLANYVTSKTAAETLGVDAKDVNVLAHMALLQTVSGRSVDGHKYYLFSKETLSNWKNHWLTHKEAIKMLSVEESTLFDLARKGLITTLITRYGAKQGIVRTWYSHQSVLELQDKMGNGSLEDFIQKDKNNLSNKEILVDVIKEEQK